MINKLISNIRKTNAPIVVGLGPYAELCSGTYPEEGFCRSSGRPWRVLQKQSGSLTKAIVDATYDLIPAVKPQIAMYEQFGIPGVDRI